MPALQTSYPETMRAGLAGMIADMTPQELITRTVEPSAGLAFGVAAFQGTGAKQAREAGGTRTFLGVVVMDPTVVHMTYQASPDFYPQNRDCSIMRRGTIWVVASVAVAAGDPASYVTATGAFAIVATASSTPIPNAIYETGGTIGALVKLRMS